MAIFWWAILCFLLLFTLVFTLLHSAVLIYSLILSAPFLSSNKKSLKTVLEKIDLSGRKKFYDLGCGSGKLVLRVAQKYPEMECIGVELNPVALFFIKLRNLFLKKKINYLRKDLYQVNLSDADVVYTYLFPKPMVKLEPKF